MNIDVNKLSAFYVELCEKQKPEKPYYCETQELKGFGTVSSGTIVHQQTTVIVGTVGTSAVTINPNLYYSIGTIVKNEL